MITLLIITGGYRGVTHTGDPQVIDRGIYSMIDRCSKPL
jgi:hypothetical protein